ncbi:hypothetical protein SteCoe_22473 [Stentor coeruleus]|uniref:TmcB/TmcC TPR repeats domain-containing protein n=1 Tax=Stentor coeruleus TaxID=5963 RepID=A0A1R2BM97_9CILI|nr:hypothetical protein SteCoe_22473 [Stentor coeruleus]
MDFLYKIWLTLYPCNRSISESASLLIIYIALYNLCILGQSLRFFWQAKSDLSNWSSFKVFWYIISAPSIDPIADYYNFMSNYVLFIIIFSSSALILFIVLAIIVGFKKKLPVFYIALTRLSIFILCDLMFIPITTMFFLIFKYSSEEFEEIEEFSENVNVKILNYSVFGQGFSVFFIGVIGIFTVFYEACAYELRLASTSIVNTSKSNSKACVLIKIVQFLNCYLATDLKASNYEAFLILCFFMYGVCAGYLIYNLPYYSFVTNLLKVYVNVDCAFLSLAFWVGLKMNRADIVALITIFSQLPILILVKETLRFRESSLPDINNITSSNFYFFELSIRKYLTSGSLKEGLLSYLVKNYHHYPCKSNRIIQAYYCSDILHNKMLGLNKIIGIQSKGLDIFTNFQVYKCKEQLKEECQNTSEGFKLHQYFVDFFKAKEKDKGFCLEYLSFIEKISRGKYKINELRWFINSLAKETKKIRKMYENILERFPTSIDTKGLYGSLLINVLNDVENGNKFIGKAEETRVALNKGMPKHHLSFANGRAFIVLSGKPETIGKLMFFTNNFLDFLHLKGKEARGLSINSLMPKDFREPHDNFLLNFLENTTNIEVFKCMPSFMLDSKGFLLECTMSSEIIGCVDSVNFICAIDMILASKDRGFSFMHPNGLLKEHSKNFPLILGLNKKSIENIYIQEIFQDFSFDDFSTVDFVQVRYNLQSKLINILIKDVQVGNAILKILYVCFDTHELHKLERLNTFDLKNIENRRISFLLASGERLDTALQADQLEKNFNEKANIYEKSAPNAQSSTSLFSSIPESNHIKQSLKVLSMTKCVLFISVFSIQLLSILISTGILIGYISDEVNKQVSLTAFLNLSDTAYSSAYLTLLTRILDIKRRSGLYSEFNMTNFKEIINDLNVNQNKLLNSYNSWSYCPASSLLKSVEINYWDEYPDTVLKQESLINLIRMMIKNVERIFEGSESNMTGYDKDLFFILYNGIGNIFDVTNNTMEDFSRCQVDRARVLKENSFYLIISGTIFQGLLMVCCIFFVMHTDRSLRILWTYLLKRVSGSSAEIIQMLKDRLINHHDISKSLSITKEPLEHIQSCRYFEYTSRYISRIFFMFFFVGLIYLVSYLVFVNALDKLLTHRPLLIKSVVQRRVQLLHLSFFTIEKDIQNTKITLDKIFPNFYPLNDAKGALINLGIAMKASKSIVNSPKAFKLMDQKLYSLIFETLEGKPYTKLGIYRAVTYLSQESTFIAYNKIQDASQDIVTFLEKILEFNVLTNTTVIRLIKVSGDIIKSKLRDFMIFVFGCSFILILLYCFVVYPFLRSETMTVRNIMSILLIIPAQTTLNYTTSNSRNAVTVKPSEKS